MRTAEAVARRWQARAATLQARPRAVVGRVPVRRAILPNGVRLYVQAAVSQPNGAAVLARASKDIARRLKGIAGQRISDEGGSNVKVAGKHACNDVWEVNVGMDRAVLSFTNFNAGRLSQIPYIGVQGPMALTVRIAHLFNA